MNDQPIGAMVFGANTVAIVLHDSDNEHEAWTVGATPYTGNLAADKRAAAQNLIDQFDYLAKFSGRQIARRARANGTLTPRPEWGPYVFEYTSNTQQP